MTKSCVMLMIKDYLSNLLKFKFSFDLLSKFRTELMGLSILGIMLGHIYIWTGLQISLLGHCIELFSRLTHTDGFLFLSGLGLYYSMSKTTLTPNSQTVFKSKMITYKSFYMRRFFRLLVPFIIISFPFYAYNDLIQTLNIEKYFFEQTSLYFWFYGNNGMWYISMSTLLYALFPFIFDFIKNKWQRCLCLVVISMLLLLTIRFLFTGYYDMTSIGISKVPIFIIGCYVGYLAKNDIRINILKYLLFFSLMILVFAWAKRSDPFFTAAYDSTMRLVTIPLCSLAFAIIVNKKSLFFVFAILKWLGKYSLELYILHMLLKHSIFSISYDLSLPFRGLLLFALSIMICKPVHDVVNKIVKKLN